MMSNNDASIVETLKALLECACDAIEWDHDINEGYSYRCPFCHVEKTYLDRWRYLHKSDCFVLQLKVLGLCMDWVADERGEISPKE